MRPAPRESAVREKRLLLVTAYFEPSRRIGARRPVRFATAMNARGWDVTVLTPHPRYMTPLDPKEPSLADSPGYRVIRTSMNIAGNLPRMAADLLSALLPRRTPVARAGSPGHPIPPTHPEKPRRLLPVSRWLARWEFPDRWNGWEAHALRAVARLRFDVVLASSPPLTAFRIGAAVAERCGARLVLDYRDPWLESPRLQQVARMDPEIMERHRVLEDSLLGKADLITSASRTVCEWLRDRCGRSPLFLPNTYQASEKGGTPGGERSHDLVYIGSLGYGRSLQPVFAALRRLLERGTLGDIRLVYAGEAGASLRRQAQQLGLDGAFRDLGYLTHKQAMAQVRRSMLGLVVTSEGYGYNIPGKLVEYFKGGTPVLLVAPAGSEAALLFREYDLGIHCVPEDIEGLARALLQARDGGLEAHAAPALFRTGPMMDRLDQALGALLPHAPSTRERHGLSPRPLSVG